ncbi:MAG TPA: SWIM zinc finger family protein [Chloroflexota bacterium]|nr:SWIM zinc finger family protein [Chloroflexota bacterium]
MALSSNERNAFIKASKIKGWELVERVQYGTYRVRSATRDRVYTVRGTDRLGRDHVCTCEAALTNRKCWHIAAVVLKRQQVEWQKARAAEAAAPVLAANVVPFRTVPAAA